MIIDSSALVAMFKGEPEKRRLVDVLLASKARLLISAATFVECSMVLDAAQDPSLGNLLDEVIREFGIEIFPVTENQAKLARQANRDYGRKSGHPAKLNFGDCLTYALAKELGEPLLFKGTDFDKTDLTPVEY